MNAIAWNDLVQELVPRLAWTLIHSAWQGMLIALLLLVILRPLRGASAQTRYAASCGAMLTLVLACVATFSVLRAPHPAPSDAVQVTSEPAFVIPQSAQVTLAPSPQLSPNERAAALGWIVLTWIIGVLALTVYHTTGWLLLQRLRRGARCTRFDASLALLQQRLRVGRAVTLIETARLDVPAALGVFKPIILVPLAVLNDLPPRQIEAILAHELAHIRRHDYLVNLLQTAIETLLFYHPAVWWMSSRVRAEREHCCDDIAAAVCGDACDYAAALTALEARRALAHVALAPAATDGNLLARVRRVLAFHPLARRARCGRSRPQRWHCAASSHLCC